MPLLAAALKGALEGAQVQAESAQAIERSVAEWSNNVIEHGYGGESGHGLRVQI